MSQKKSQVIFLMYIYYILQTNAIFQHSKKQSEEQTTKLQELRSSLEAVQSQQTEDSRNISRQQKTTERYLAKKQMLTSRRDDCNRNIRDLGVLPEEAFEKYITEKLERVRDRYHHTEFATDFMPPARQETAPHQRRAQKIRACE